jgi:hypothetical protein
LCKLVLDEEETFDQSITLRTRKKRIFLCLYVFTDIVVRTLSTAMFGAFLVSFSVLLRKTRFFMMELAVGFVWGLHQRLPRDRV